MHATELALTLVTLALLSGCATTHAPTHYELFMQPEPTGGLKRAAFDLQCDVKELQVTDLGSAVGVTGCGKRAAYKFVNGTGWVNNTGSSQ